jgi:hypothetical protein
MKPPKKPKNKKSKDKTKSSGPASKEPVAVADLPRTIPVPVTSIATIGQQLLTVAERISASP